MSFTVTEVTTLRRVGVRPARMVVMSRRKWSVVGSITSGAVTVPCCRRRVGEVPVKPVRISAPSPVVIVNASSLLTAVAPLMSVTCTQSML